MTPATDLLPVLAALLAIASAGDVAVHRIPNALVLSVLATGLLAQGLATPRIPALAGSLGAVLVVGIVTWPAWTRSWLGGADLKLAAATAAWLGLEHVPVYLLASAVSVGAVSVVCYGASARAARSEVRRNLAIAARGVAIAAPLGAEGGRVQVPAGLGFALGALATLALAGRL